MIVGAARETRRGERRVSLVPAAVPALVNAGHEVLIEKGAGQHAGYPDSAYVEKGARIAGSRGDIYSQADIVLRIHASDTNPGELRSGQKLIGFLDPLNAPRIVQDLAPSGADLYSMELIPRITRAQSMDALSSMATVAGYKAAVLAAERLPRLFPMLMTAAGTISPAKVFVVGAGVAGLQAIATARRLGAVVEAYDVRPTVREQVESVGAKFLEIPLESTDAEDVGGYAKAQDESFYRRQRELMARAVAASDVVITTAAIPGQKAPVLVTEEMVKAMAPGSVIVDLAAERGGNCELTRPDEVVEAHGVTVIGPANLA
ncbi:MAG: NAD(P) transhydrogenase subunit alpha, partial [Bryobacteraceae bacterium]|nr:NAD(P) transhydrogenase subunit alpha [Bryobacteraceae bacterium]